MKTEWINDGLCAAGLVMVTSGAWLYSLPLALIVGGICLVVFGIMRA